GGDTGLAIYARFTNPNQQTRVGFSAHLGGFVADCYEPLTSDSARISLALDRDAISLFSGTYL
ncbi:unnamed protein product, partial [Trichobilharzia regenti]